MTGWEFDEARFRDDVLIPVQAGWPPEDNLFRVYLLPLDTEDATAVRTALDDLRRRFGLNRYAKSFGVACQRLRAQHDQAATVLGDPARRRAHREQVRAGREKLATTLRQRLDGAPGLPPAQVAALAAASKGSYTVGDIRTVLVGLRAAEQEPAAVPATAPPAGWPAARGALAQLRRPSLWSYLAQPCFGGLGTTSRQLDARRQELRVRRDAGSEAETNLLKVMEKWLPNGGLAAALRHELLDEVAGRAEYGYAEALQAARGAADRLTALGLPGRPDALAYALWCDRRFGAGTAAWERDYQAAIASRELRTALRTLRSQASLPGGWNDTAKELTGRLSGLDEQLAAAGRLERTDREAAADIYLRVATELADPAIDTALARCPPAAPSSATARVDGDRVVVSWVPSTPAAGVVTYSVLRGVGGRPSVTDPSGSDSVLGTELSGRELVDGGAPDGRPLIYAVVAERHGVRSATAAVSSPVIVRNEVSDAVAEGAPDSIRVRWRLPGGAVGAVVTRRRQDDRRESVVDGAGTTDAVDRDVTQGIGYEYRIRARYRDPGGVTTLTEGALVTCSCQELPVAVRDLRLTVDDGELLARWTPPRSGDVRLRDITASGAAGIPVGEVVALRTTERYGAVVPATGARVPGRLRSPAGARERVLLPVTVLGDLAAIGAPARVDARQSRVRSLRAQTLSGAVRLSWEWPDGATTAQVVWSSGSKPGGPTDPQACRAELSKASYDGRGFERRLAAGQYWFGVCTAVRNDTGVSYGPLELVEATVTGRASYQVRKDRFARSYTITVDCDGGGELPDLVVVGKSGTRPEGPDDGRRLAHIQAGPSPRTAKFSVDAGLRRPVHLRAYPVRTGLVLMSPRMDQLVIR
jgi:hypothetical protein